MSDALLMKYNEALLRGIRTDSVPKKSIKMEVE